MRKFLFMLGLAAVFLYACQSDNQTLTTEQGTEYTLHTDAGNAKAQPGEYVFFHAQMRNGDSILYSTREQGQNPVIQIPTEELPGGQQLGPVEDVLSYLGVGDSATIGIRIDTLPQRPPGFENADVLYYDVVVTEIVDEETFNQRQEEEQAARQAEMDAVIARAPEALAYAENIRAQYMAGALEEQVQSTDSGLKYIIHEDGTGARAEQGQVVDVQYIGMLPDGSVFDQSFERGQSIQFPLGAGRVIPGWDEGIALLREGSKATLIIPSELGYGEAGSPPVIPANSDLIFYVELEGVN